MSTRELILAKMKKNSVDSYKDEPTKPTEPSFEGFDGSLSHESGEKKETDPTEPDPVSLGTMEPVRPVLSVGSWVRSDDRIGQVVSYAEGEAVVRIFNDYGGFHDMRMAVSGLIPTEAPERPPMPVPGYMAGDRVRYSYKEAMNVREGTIVETRIFPAGCWYRIKDGDTLRWISEGHIQKERAQ
ncbi:MAG: hypothetical protein UBAL2_79310416 [Leptospirillum rubarum]|nr:MAG: hypothetical protein UBAL2_79310416 [Leptospirillum rubarum]